MTGTEGTLRLFVALEVPPEVTARLVEAQAALHQALPRLHAAWSKPDQMHLTLRFLGSVPAAAGELLLESLRPAAAGHAALELEARGLGAFPGWRRPRVLWAGVAERGPAGGLASLQRAVRETTQAFTAEPAEPRFHPHITLARVRQAPEHGGLEEFARGLREASFGRWTARELVLMRSQLEAAGSRHTAMGCLRLGGPA